MFSYNDRSSKKYKTLLRNTPLKGSTQHNVPLNKNIVKSGLSTTCRTSQFQKITVLHLLLTWHIMCISAHISTSRTDLCI